MRNLVSDTCRLTPAVSDRDIAIGIDFQCRLCACVGAARGTISPPHVPASPDVRLASSAIRPAPARAIVEATPHSSIQRATRPPIRQQAFRDGPNERFPRVASCLRARETPMQMLVNMFLHRADRETRRPWPCSASHLRMSGCRTPCSCECGRVCVCPPTVATDATYR